MASARLLGPRRGSLPARTFVLVLGALGSMVLLFISAWLTGGLTGVPEGLPAVGGLTAVGTLIVVRRTRNIVGWLCYTAGLLASLAIFSEAYAKAGLVDRAGSLPGVMVLGWFSLWLGAAWTSVLLFIPLVFPDGRFPSRRWRSVAWVVAAFLTVHCVSFALSPAVSIAGSAMPYNPLGIDGSERLFAFLEPVVTAGFAVSLAVTLSAVGVRFNRSTGTERLQLKWLLYASAQLVALFGVDMAVPGDFPQPFSDIIFVTSFSLIPAAIAIAVLRYRLYDINRIINRTIVYATVTVTLGAIYAGSVVVTGSLFSGQGMRPEWVVAASTLAAFGAFRPIRTHTQHLVDRRFNRARYDARRTVTAFSETLREELDVDALADELLRVAREAVQPREVAVWLRRPTPPSTGGVM